MSNYRDIIYGAYRTTSYAAKNPDDLATKRSAAVTYDAELGGFLPADKQARILDLGCGSGFLVRFLLDKGYKNVLGVDTSIEQVEHAQANNLPVLRANALEFLKKDDKFDLIITTDVIEHLKKDEIMDFLHGIKEGLVAGGSIIIRTINASSIYGSSSRYIDMTHELSFTGTSMNQVLLATGFESIDITDNKIPFGVMPKRFARWALSKVWRGLLNLIYLVEIGEDRPLLLGKLLIARARKPSR